MKTYPSKHRLSRLILYKPKSGHFYHRATGGRITVNSGRAIVISGRKFMLSRIAWILMTGGIPISGCIIHRNGDKTDFRWKNLELLKSVNSANPVDPYIPRELITVDDVSARIRYDATSGFLYWTGIESARRKRGLLRGSKPINICGCMYERSHIAWLLSTGELPPQGMLVDHINADHRDNRLVNLRLVTPLHSARNRRMQRNNTSGYNGVHETRYKRYEARLKVLGENLYLGVFDTAEEAWQAFEREKLRYGFAELHGYP